MKYGEMVKFLNDNGILVMQPVIASELDGQLENGIPEEDFEEICENVMDTYLDCCFDSEPDIHQLVAYELKRYKNKLRLQYLREKDRVCPLDKYEMWELIELEDLED